MIDNLKQIEDKMILNLLSQPNKWETKLVNYFPPVVERCWIQLGNYRLMLHFIHECKSEEALFHTHRWPSAMHVLSGKYEMGLGFGEGDVPPPKMATILFDNGGYYDMTHKDGWHYVRPIGGVCATTMLIGSVWDREETAKDFGKLGPLTNERKLVMLGWFADWYRNKLKISRMQENLKNIRRGDWIQIDEMLMNDYEKKSRQAYLGKNGFVIGINQELIDVRFGNDRMTLGLNVVKLLDPSTKPSSEELDKVNKDRVAGEQKAKKDLDAMDPKSWEDDNFE